MSGGNVVPLHERAAGFALPDHAAFRDWAIDWVESLFADGKAPATLIILIEDHDGRLTKVSQSVNRLDRARFVGLLQTAIAMAIDDELAAP